jgi:hypothetical protein
VGRTTFQDLKNFRSATLNTLLVALPLLRHNHSAIKTKWEGDRAVTANLSNRKPFKLQTLQTLQTSNSFNAERLYLFSRTPTSKAQLFCNKDQVGGRQGSNRKPFKPQTFQTSNSFNEERLYLLVALPHLWQIVLQ